MAIFETDYGTKTELQMASVRAAKYVRESYQDKFDDWLMDVLIDAILNCPWETGTLASSGRIEDGIVDPSGFAGVSGGIPDFGSSYDLMDRSIIFGGWEYTKPDGSPCIYGDAVHNGHVTKDGGYYTGDPFLTDSFEAHEKELDAIFNDLAKDVSKAFEDGGKKPT